MTDAARLAEYTEALKSVGDILAADGYLMNLSAPSPGELLIDVTAGPEACAECLVPKDLMAGIAMDALGTDSGIARIEIKYPLVAGH